MSYFTLILPVHHVCHFSLVLPSQDAQLYKEVKRVSDTDVGIASQCFVVRVCLFPSAAASVPADACRWLWLSSFCGEPGFGSVSDFLHVASGPDVL